MTAEPEAGWTVFVYMAADENTREAAEDSLRRLEKVGSKTGALNIVVQIDWQSGQRRDERFRVLAAGRRDHVEKLAEVHTERASTLRKFLNWGLPLFRARKYALVLWGHGLGVGYDLAQEIVLLDDDGGLGIGDLADVLKGFGRKDDLAKGSRFSFVGFDACNMSSAELAYELRDCADYIAASQTRTPAAVAWPYDAILRLLRETPNASPRDLGLMTVQKVTSRIRSARAGLINKSTTITLLDVRQSRRLCEPLKELVAAMTGVLGSPVGLTKLKDAFREAPYLKTRQFIDVRGLCGQLDKRFPAKRVGEAARRLDDAARAVVVAHQAVREARKLHGLSIYFRPIRGRDYTVRVSSASYRRLALAKKTAWYELTFHHFPNYRDSPAVDRPMRGETHVR